MALVKNFKLYYAKIFQKKKDIEKYLKGLNVLKAIKCQIFWDEISSLKKKKLSIRISIDENFVKYCIQSNIVLNTYFVKYFWYYITWNILHIMLSLLFFFLIMYHFMMIWSLQILISHYYYKFWLNIQRRS